MRIVTPLTAILAGGLLVVGSCAGPNVTFVGSAEAWRGHPPKAEALAAADLGYYWEMDLQLPHSESVARMDLLDDVLYCLTSENRLFAVDAVRGLYLWSYAVADRGEVVFAPCHATNVLPPSAGPPGEPRLVALQEPVKPFDATIINTVTRAFVFDRQSGQLVHELKLSFAANTPGSSDGTYLYLGSARGWYYSVRLYDGIDRWVMATRDMISVRPVLFSQRLYVASQDGNVVVVNPEAAANRRVWRQTTDGPLTGQFHVDTRGCFVPSQDHRLYAFDNLTGQELWTFRSQAELRAPVQVGKQTVFQYAQGEGLHAIDLATGRQRWSLPQGRAVLGASGDNVYVLTGDRKLLVVNEMLGQPEAALPADGLTKFVLNADKAAIFAGTGDGRLRCIRPVASEPLTAEALRGGERVGGIAPPPPPAGAPPAAPPVGPPPPPAPATGP